MSKAARTWLITGAGRGLGHHFARAALGAGDYVIAAARDVSALEEITAAYPNQVCPVRLDLADQDTIRAAIDLGAQYTGRIDVLVNNAGYGLGGAVEEVTDEQLRHQMEVNFFGPVACTRAVLPIMRAQRAGHIVQISTIGGLAAFTYLSMYHASKWALEGFSESLAQEVSSFGVRVTIVEPGPFRTEWNGPSLVRATPMPEYEEVLAARRWKMSGVMTGSQPGDPSRAAQALLQMVDCAEPPLRLLLGNFPADTVRRVYAERLASFDAWDTLSRSVDFD